MRAKNLAKKQTDEAKDKRINWKKARVQEQEEQKMWNRRQTIHHTYGSDDDENEDNVESTEQHGSKASTAMRKCKCGSSDHRYTSHLDCPLNKKHVVPEDTDDSTLSIDHFAEEDVYTCGSRTHSRSCPLNPRNLRNNK